jgi:hypothetical protein
MAPPDLSQDLDSLKDAVQTVAADVAALQALAH